MIGGKIIRFPGIFVYIIENEYVSTISCIRVRVVRVDPEADVRGSAANECPWHRPGRSVIFKPESLQIGHNASGTCAFSLFR